MLTRTSNASTEFTGQRCRIFVCIDTLNEVREIIEKWLCVYHCERQHEPPNNLMGKVPDGGRLRSNIEDVYGTKIGTFARAASDDVIFRHLTSPGSCI